MTDKEKLFKLRTDESFFTKIYNEHKGYSIRFLKKMNHDFELLEDIYQDAMVVLYEKSKDSDFQLTSSIQTYVNSICRNQLLTKFKQNSQFISKDDDFDSNICDWFDDDQYDDDKEKRITILENSLEKLKMNAEKCYEILKQFYYDKNSNEEIAALLGYTNGNNVKNQKSRCQKKLKDLALEQYESI